MDSPVMDASSNDPVPEITSPSTGTLAPILTRTTSPMATLPADTSTCSPLRMTTAVSGATATSSASAARVLFSVADSSAWPMANRKVTAAASQYSPMISAPMAAMLTRRSMLMLRTASALTALRRIGVPAITAADAMIMSAANVASKPLEAINEIRINKPDRIEIVQRPLIHALILFTLNFLYGVSETDDADAFSAVRHRRACASTGWHQRTENMVWIRSKWRHAGGVSDFGNGGDEFVRAYRLCVVLDHDAG